MNQAEDQSQRVVAQSAASEAKPVKKKKKYFGATLLEHWFRTALFLFLFVEDTRLMLTYGGLGRVIVMVVVGIMFAYLLIMLIRALRQRAQDRQLVSSSPVTPSPPV